MNETKETKKKKGGKRSSLVNENHIAQVVSEWTKIPLQRLAETEVSDKAFTYGYICEDRPAKQSIPKEARTSTLSETNSYEGVKDHMARENILLEP